MSLESIELLAKEHAADRALLAMRVEALNSELTAVKNRRLVGIKNALGSAKDSRLRLQAAVEASRDQFASPRTRVFHNIKVGFAKGKGKLTFSNAKDVVKLIRRYLADKADVLIKVDEKPVKKALQQLPAADLKRIGCEITGTGDCVVVEPADSELDKFVDALLNDGNDAVGDEDAE